MQEPTEEIIAIKNIVDRVFKIDISSKERTRCFVDARRVYFKISTDLCKSSQSVISRYVNKDHASLIHSLKSFNYNYNNDTEFFRKYNKCLRVVNDVFSLSEPISEKEFYESELIKTKVKYENKILTLKNKLKEFKSKKTKLEFGIKQLNPEQQLEFYNNRFIPFAKVHKIQL